MNKRVLTRFMIASSIALAVPLRTYGDPLSDGPEGRCEQMYFQGLRAMVEDVRLPRLLRRLDLTENQRDRIFDILYARVPAIREQAKALRKASLELRAMALSGRFDEARAAALVEAGADARAGMASIRNQIENQIHQALSPEQRQRLQDLGSRLVQRRGLDIDRERSG